MAMCCKSNIGLFDFVVLVVRVNDCRLTHLFKLLSFFQFYWITPAAKTLDHPGAVPRGDQGGPPPVKFLAPLCPSPKKKFKIRPSLAKIFS